MSVTQARDLGKFEAPNLDACGAEMMSHVATLSGDEGQDLRNQAMELFRRAATLRQDLESEVPPFPLLPFTF